MVRAPSIKSVQTIFLVSDNMFPIVVVFSRFGKLTTIFLLKIFAWVDKMGGTRFWRGWDTFLEGDATKNWTFVHSPACPPTMSTITQTK